MIDNYKEEEENYCSSNNSIDDEYETKAFNKYNNTFEKESISLKTISEESPQKLKNVKFSKEQYYEKSESFDSRKQSYEKKKSKITSSSNDKYPSFKLHSSNLIGLSQTGKLSERNSTLSKQYTDKTLNDKLNNKSNVNFGKTQSILESDNKYKTTNFKKKVTLQSIKAVQLSEDKIDYRIIKKTSKNLPHEVIILEDNKLNSNIKNFSNTNLNNNLSKTYGIGNFPTVKLDNLKHISKNFFSSNSSSKDTKNVFAINKLKKERDILRKNYGTNFYQTNYTCLSSFDNTSYMNTKDTFLNSKYKTNFKNAINVNNNEINYNDNKSSIKELVKVVNESEVNSINTNINFVNFDDNKSKKVSFNNTYKSSNNAENIKEEKKHKKSISGDKPLEYIENEYFFKKKDKKDRKNITYLNTNLNSVASTEKTNKIKNNKINFQDELKQTKTSFTLSNNKINVNKQQYFCPHCSHCNIKDEYLDEYISNLKESKNIINKYALYLLQTNVLSENSNNLFSDTHIKNMIMNESNEKKDFPLNIHSDQIKYNSSFLEEKLNELPKSKLSNKNSRIILGNLYEALLEKKESIHNLLEPEIRKKLENSLLSIGQSYSIKSSQNNSMFNEIFYDRELMNMMDDQTLLSIKELVKKKILENEEFKKDEASIIKSKQDLSQKFLVLFSIFIQILAEISTEDKTKAILLYKFFKHYFVEQDKKWITILNEMKSKVKYYKTLSKIIIQQKNKHLKQIEEISEVLVSNKLTQNNLKKHKELIQELIAIIQEKRDEIYLQNSEINTLKKELNFWLFDFENLKINKDIRKRMAEIDKEKVINAINKELGHKNLNKSIHNLVAISDIYIILSGQRKYFFDQKDYYLGEISKVTKSNLSLMEEIDETKLKYRQVIEDIENVKRKNNEEMLELRAKIMVDKTSTECQTNIDYLNFNFLVKNNDSYLDLKKINQSKLSEVYDNIIYNCSLQMPISKFSLIRLIPEILAFKFEQDMIIGRSVKENMILIQGKNTLANNFYNYFLTQFNVPKLAMEKMESTLKSIITYSNENKKIELFRKLIGIGSNCYSNFIAEKYFNILKCKIF